MTVLEQLTIDPTSEDAGNAPLDLIGGAYAVTEFRTPTPAADPRWAQPADADGDRLVASRYQNRQISVSVEIVPAGPTAAADAQAALAALADKIAKVNREGGTLRRVLPSGDAIVFDLLAADPLDPTWDAAWDVANAIGVELTFTAMPFGRGDEAARSVHAETTSPVLTFVENGIPGDVPALGRLIVSEAQGFDQAWLTWGLQSASYDPAATAGLLYEAESRTPASGASTVTQSGFSGGNGVEGTLGTAWRAILSTQASGGGAQLTHQGSYRVIGRVLAPTGNLGDLSVALEWAQGDFLRFTRNPVVTLLRLAYSLSFDVSGSTPDVVGHQGETDQGSTSNPSTLLGTPRILDLGLVDLTGGQWEGRVVAASTVGGDKLRIDWLALVPAERSGEASGVQQLASTNGFLAQDGFDQASGNLDTKVLPTTGTWATSGATTDFTVDTTTHAAKRVASGIRYALAGASTPTATLVSARVSGTLTGGSTLDDFSFGGVLGRWTDASNHLALLATSGALADAWIWALLKVVGGSSAFMGWGTVPFTAYPAATPLRISLFALPDGTAAVHIGQAGRPEVEVYRVPDADIGVGGTLASGQAGIVHRSPSGSSTVFVDDFELSVPALDAAAFASREIEIAADGVWRQDSAGTLWTPVSRHDGDGLLVPPAGAEGRSTRFFVKLSRGMPQIGIDGGIDDVSAQLFLTPRYLVVP